MHVYLEIYFLNKKMSRPEIKPCMRKIHSGLSHVQQEVMSVNHKMKEVMIKLPTLHITLMVMSLQTEEDIARARAALTESGCELRERFKTLPVLEVAGLGTFRNQVVFATVSPGDALDDLTHIHQCVIDKMADHEVVSTETKGLTPHITIMKMSKVKAAFRRSVAKKIDPSLYSQFKEMTFGTETVQRLQLCAMLKPKDTSGYYHVAHEVYLGQGEVTVSELSRCLVQSSIVSALEKVKLDSVMSQMQVNSQDSKGKPEHKPQKKKQKSKKSKEVKK
ncbi:A-kinase anchor protein 7-like isoform X3 [Haliotis rubra]|uniref:A-kinase anchor protein 7-like isoform X3 n=1 Tax=Haliotis rubra TaxID=36100 RepID=UPI001EE5CE94|nr:A-kinase anchor protein 7-like isoform X3 [Haliotis rubra]